MSKIILLGDVHMDAGTHRRDSLWALSTLRRYAKLNNIDDIVLLGDLFHNRRTIGIDCLSQSYTFFQKAKAAKQNWIMFPGNHDMYQRHEWSITSLDHLSEVAVILNDVSLISFDGHRFWVVPFIENEVIYMNVMQLISTKAEPGDSLLTHIGAAKSKLNSCFLLQHWALIDFDKTDFRRVYTGHFHIHQQVGSKTWYTGSLLPMRFEEGDCDHGFMILDLDTWEHELVDVISVGKEYWPDQKAPARFMTVPYDQLSGLTDDEVAGNNIRIAIDTQIEKVSIESSRSDLLFRGANKVTVLDLTRNEAVNAIDASTDGVLCFDELFNKWIQHDQKSIRDLDQHHLLTVDHEIRIEGDRRYVENNGVQ